jgi:Ca2+-binding RTX toxin-like protein
LLTGGSGNDTFVFDAPLNAVDTITDFDARGADQIELDQSVFTMLSVGSPLAAANFAANEGGNAVNADHYVLYDTATGNLYYDADGSGAGAKSLFATLTLAGVGGTVDSSDFDVTP